MNAYYFLDLAQLTVIDDPKALTQIAVLRFYCQLSQDLAYKSKLFLQEDIIKNLNWLMLHFEKDKLFDDIFDKSFTVIEKIYLSGKENYALFGEIFRFLKFHLISDQVEASKKREIAKQAPALLCKISLCIGLNTHFTLRDFSLLLIHFQEECKDHFSLKLDLATKLLFSLFNTKYFTSTKEEATHQALLYFSEYLISQKSATVRKRSIFHSQKFQLLLFTTRLKIFDQQGGKVKPKDIWFNWNGFLGLLGEKIEEGTRKIILGALEHSLTYFALTREHDKIAGNIKSWCETNPSILTKKERQRLREQVEKKRPKG